MALTDTIAAKQPMGNRPTEGQLALAQLIAEDEVEGVVHPAKALAVAHQLHEQSGRGQNGHAGDEAAAGNDVVQAGKEQTKRTVQNLALDVGSVAVLPIFGAVGCESWLGAKVLRCELLHSIKKQGQRYDAIIKQPQVNSAIPTYLELLGILCGIVGLVHFL